MRPARRTAARLTRVLRRATAGRRSARSAAGVRAVYADVLDGDHLWLAVTGVPEGTTVALEVQGAGGAVVPLEPELVEPLAGGGTSLRADLLELPLPRLAPGQDLTAAVVAVAPDGSRVPVRTEPLPDRGPTRPPASSRGRWAHAVERRRDGALLLRRTALAPWAEVASLAATDDELVAVVADPPPSADAGPMPSGGLRFVLVDADGTVVAHLDASPSEPGGPSEAARRQARVPAAVRLEPGALLRLELELPGSGTRLPVRRAADGLRTPDAAVLLPGIEDDQHERPLLRWRWTDAGDLAVVRPRQDAAP